MVEHASGSREEAAVTGEVRLRDVLEEDLPIFFEQQLDPGANQMAAFTARDPTDREAFMAHWTKIRGDGTNTNKTILFRGQVAGYIVSFRWYGERDIGYWIGKPFWGQGVATRALAAFVALLPERPLYARAARDNLASIRVLEKCGFTISGYDKAFANVRGAEIEEVILVLGANVGVEAP